MLSFEQDEQDDSDFQQRRYTSAVGLHTHSHSALSNPVSSVQCLCFYLRCQHSGRTTLFLYS